MLERRTPVRNKLHEASLRVNVKVPSQGLSEAAGTEVLCVLHIEYHTKGWIEIRDLNFQKPIYLGQ